MITFNVYISGKLTLQGCQISLYWVSKKYTGWNKRYFDHYSELPDSESHCIGHPHKLGTKSSENFASMIQGDHLFKFCLFVSIKYTY